MENGPIEISTGLIAGKGMTGRTSIRRSKAGSCARIRAAPPYLAANALRWRATIAIVYGDGKRGAKALLPLRKRIPFGGGYGPDDEPVLRRGCAIDERCGGRRPRHAARSRDDVSHPGRAFAPRIRGGPARGVRSR